MGRGSRGRGRGEPPEEEEDPYEEDVEVSCWAMRPPPAPFLGVRKPRGLPLTLCLF